MSLPRILTAVLCGGFLMLGSAKAQQPGKDLRTCKFRFAWWAAPENPPELALQADKDRIPLSPDVLSLSVVVDYRGEPNAIVLKKTVTTELDKSGKPIVQWVPYCTVSVGPTDTDLAVLLFPDEKRGVAQTRVFDFSPEGFPYGTVQLINFTSARVAVSIDGTTFVANSRGASRYPKVFSKRTVCSFKMAVAEPSGEEKLLRSTTMIFKPNARLLLFALEYPGLNEEDRYHTELIIDNLVVKKTAPVAEPGDIKGKGVPAKGKKAEATPAKKSPAPAI
jgi:hypothetical protein